MMDVAGMDYAYEDMFKEISRKLYGTVGTVGAVGTVVDAVTMQQQQANGQAANGQSVIAGVFNGVINEAIVVNGKMADFADAFKQQQQLSPEQQASPPHQEAGGVIVEAAAAAAAAYLQEQFQAETEAAAAALVGAAGVADGDAMAVEYTDQQAVAQPMEEDEAAAGPGQAQAGEGEVDPNAPDTWFMTDESLEWTDSKIASYNPKQKLFRCIDCECCGFLARVAEHWLGTHANLRVFQCPHCPYASAWARCVRMHLARQHNASEQNALWTENPVLGEVTKYLSRLRARVEAGPLVVVAEEDLVDEEQQQLELEQHEQQLHEQQLREQQLHEQQLHEQQMREQQLHEQQLQQQLQQQQLQQQAAAAAAAAVASGSPTHTEYVLGVPADSVVISGNVLSVQTATPATLTTNIATTSLAAQPGQPGQPGPARVRNRGGKGPRRVNKAIAVAAAVAAATARGDAPDAAAAAGAAAKRYNCTSCPYQTDRRDLYTRHEAIHLAEKPFHCYACQKQFNRADHVKKHFLRMHRDQPYDLNRIRRTASSKPPSPSVTAAAATTVVTTALATTAGNGSTMAFYTKFGAASTTTLSDPDDVNGVPTTSVTDDQELQLQQLELEQQQLEQQQLQQHELQLQQQELQLQQQQIILQTQHLQQQQAPAINIPNMANYATALSSRLLSDNGHAVKDGQGVVQLAPMASVITESKVAGGGVVVVPEGVVSAVQAVQVGAAAEDAHDAQEVPRTRGGREKRYPCPYCTWSGVDNWCLKRHLNTHLKPYVCALCDYKAARTERLQTHVLKVHNKRSCVRCKYMADDQNQLNAHLQEHHGQLDLVPPPPRAKRGPRKTGVGGAGPWGHPLPGTLPGPMYQPSGPGPHDVMNHIRRPAKRWRPRPQGADRLFNYMEASDSEDELELLPEDMLCQQCGLEFLDSESLQTHLMSMHRMTLAPAQGPASRPYHCTICGYSSHSHPDIVAHMQKHAVVEMRCMEPGCSYSSSVPGAMEEHVGLAHPPMPPLNQKCPHCGFVVLSATALSRHAKTHHLATVQCGACSRVHQRFDRHRLARTGQMWSEEEQEDDEELMAAAAQAAEDAVNAIDDDGDPDAEPRPSPKSLSDHELALRALRRQWRTRRRRLRRYTVMRKELKRLLEPSTTPDGEELPSFPGVPEAVVRLRLKHVGRWLARRRLSCFACPPARRHTLAVHTVETLAAHRVWRHRRGGTPFPCDSCDARFDHRYQALLHASKDHADIADHDAEAARQRAIAEPIVTLTVPQYMASSATTTTTAAAGHLVELQGATHLPHDQQTFAQLEALQPQVYQVQAAEDGAAEAYAMDGASITVVPVLYTCASQPAAQPGEAEQQGDADPQEQLQQEQFQQGTLYNGVMVPAVPAAQPGEAEQQGDADPQEQLQQEQFQQGTLYNGVMVPAVPAVPAVAKQVWYPQLSTPSYYISTQFPST